MTTSHRDLLYCAFVLAADVVALVLVLWWVKTQ